MTNILIVIDPEETEHSALSRIKEIPVSADINFKVDFYLDAVPVSAEEASKIDFHIKDRRAWLDQLVEPYRSQGYKITTEILPFRRLYEEIIKSARQFKADFVFKPTRQHNTLKRVFYTPNDWNLIRLCPTPLLMVSDQREEHGKPVVAAIDVSDKDTAHQSLNEVVLEQAGLLSRVLGSDIHIVFAYGPSIVAGRSAIADPLAYQISRDRYDEFMKAAKELAKNHGVACDNVHMREGAPDMVIDEYAREADAGVIVLGTVARRGAAGLFVGNTAEGVLERTNTDVFVVKVPGFEAHV